MTLSIGIAGAGLSGRLVALNCLARGWQVSLFDSDTHAGQQSCGWVGAGMIAPYTELESSEPLLCELGLQSLSLWPKLLEQLDKPVTFNKTGTLILAHPQDKGERERLITIVDHKLRTTHLPNLSSVATFIPKQDLSQFAPGLSPNLQDAYWIKEEGHINSHEFYQASTAQLIHKKCTWHTNTTIETVRAHELKAGGKTFSFDWVFDCRGLGAKKEWPELRGIRGEVLCLQAPEVTFSCPVRIMHPRYPIYISPRANNNFIVGATSIESDDKSPISAQSMLELLSACYTVHPGFAEARIMQTMTQCRPTLPDNKPKLKVSSGLIRLNGLYRHGYMIGPAVVNEVMNYIEHGAKAITHPELFVDELKELVCT